MRKRIEKGLNHRNSMIDSKNIKYIFILFLAGGILTITSCFKEDEKIFPPAPGTETVFTFGKSIYDYQSFFDFSSDTTTAVSANNLWQIEFATASKAWEIRVNSAAYYQVYKTGDTAFNGIATVTDPLKYIFDTSSGYADSSAFASWLDRSAVPAVPSREVFLVGLFDGIKVKAKWKIRIENVTDTSYSFTYATFPSGTPRSVVLIKDKSVSYQQYDLVNQSAVGIEPAAIDYDLLFTQYGTILYDNTGVATPYFVRGILLNPYKVEASLDTVHAFADITYDLIKDNNFSKVRDVIGHTWKDVKVDQVGNTAEYFVNTKLNWLIKDTEGFIYKMRFIEFYNSQAQVGYTTIEYQRL
jgi:hypothetical protein